MGIVQLAKNWAGGITPNLRRSYSSLNDMAGWWIYENTQRLNAKWTRVWECDGTTGPTDADDDTARLVDVAACSTRGADATSAQSWGVYEASDGAQISIAYQGASDSIIRIAYSLRGKYTLAATTTNQPTADDECVISALNSIVATTTSGDRVMSVWCLDGDWRCAIFRSNAVVNVLGLAHVTPLVAVRAVNPIFDPPYVAWRYTNCDRSGTPGRPTGGTNGTGIGAINYTGAMARVYTDMERNIRVAGGEVVLASSSASSAQLGGVFQVDKPALQNGEGSPLLPIYWSGERSNNCDGFLGSPIDWWACYASNAANVPLPGDSFYAIDHPGSDLLVPRANFLMGIGSAVVWAWCNVAATMETA